MKKFLTIVGLVTAMATPAFAQALSPGYGTGNPTPFSFTPDGKAHQVITPGDQQPAAKPLYNYAGKQHSRTVSTPDNASK
jgi:hypothetical protein